MKRILFFFLVLLLSQCYLAVSHAAYSLNDTNGIYTDDFADASGISTKNNADVDVSDGTLKLTDAGGTFTAPFNTSGYAVLSEIRPRSVAKWVTLSIVATIPTSTSITVQVMDDNNSLFSDTYVPQNSTGVSSFPVDLSQVPVLQCADPWTPGAPTPPSGMFDDCNNLQAIRLQIMLTTTDPSVTPAVDSLQVTWTLKQGDLSSSTFSNAPWATDMGNEQGTYQSRYSNPATYPAIRWVSQKYVGDNFMDDLYALNDKLFGWTSSNVGRMFAMDRDNGSELWQMPFSRGGAPHGVIAQNATFYGTDIGNDLFYTIDTNTGQIKWTYNFYGGHGNSQTVIGNDGTIYTIRSNGDLTSTIYAFNPDGTVKWTEDIVNTTPGASEANTSYMSLSNDGTILYFGTFVLDSSHHYLGTGKLYAISLTDPDHSPNHCVWAYPTGDLGYAAPLVDSQGTIYVGTFNWNGSEEIRLYAINPDDGSLKNGWPRSFSTGDYGVWNLALRSDGNLWMAYMNADRTMKIMEISSADGSTLWNSGALSANNTAMSDSVNGTYFVDSNYDVATATISRLKYYDANGNLKWQMPYVYDSTAGGGGGLVSYTPTNPVPDERGWIYSALGKSRYDGSFNELPDQEYAEAFALAPWTLLASTDKSLVAPGNAIAFSVTTAMQQTNLLTDDPNQMQVVLDTGVKVPLAYASTNGGGDTVWTGTYATPNDMSTSSHAYTVEANAAGIQTDIPLHFDSPAVNSSGTGITASGTFLVDTTPPTTPTTVLVGGGGGGGTSWTPPPAPPAASSTTNGTSTMTGTLRTAQMQLLNTLIAQLLVLLQQAQAQGIALPPGAAQFLGGPSPAPAGPLSFAFHFANDMGIGTVGSEVHMLQRVLNALGFTVDASGPGSPGNETTTFGPATRSALKRYQQSAGISATGYLGPLTRARLNRLSE